MKSIVILISGRGSNMEALVESDVKARFAAVISNTPGAQGLAIAQARGIPTAVIDHRTHAARESFDLALLKHIEPFQPDLIVLAEDGFVQAFEGRLINVHVFAAFPGTHTHQRALDEGVKVHGCTVHFVTPALDSGPIIAQAAVPVLDEDTAETLAARVLAQEHRILPRVVRWFVEGEIHLDGRRVRVSAARQHQCALISPAFS